MSKYRKTIVAVAGAAAAWAVLVLESASGPITGGEVAAGVIGLATALGVWGVPNTTD